MKITIAILALLSGAEAKHHGQHRTLVEKMLTNLSVTPDKNYYYDYDTFFLPKNPLASDVQREQERGE